MFDEEKMNYILQKRRKMENEVENCHVIYIYGYMTKECVVFMLAILVGHLSCGVIANCSAQCVKEIVLLQKASLSSVKSPSECSRILHAGNVPCDGPEFIVGSRKGRILCENGPGWLDCPPLDIFLRFRLPGP